MVLHLDVGLFQSIKAGSIFEERAHLIIKYVSWVQNDVNQFGPYLLKYRKWIKIDKVRKDLSSYNNIDIVIHKIVSNLVDIDNMQGIFRSNVYDQGV